MSRFWVRFLVIGISLWGISFWGTPIYGNPIDGFSDVLPPYLAERRGKDSCWVRFRQESQDGFICVRKKVWLHWLSLPTAEPLVLESVRTSWKAYSPLVNTPSSEEARRKPVFFVRWAETSKSTPSSAPDSLFQLKYTVWRTIERERERVSELLRKSDPLGVFRSLLLQEADPSGSIPLLRRLGFVHLASATGIHLYALQNLIDGMVRFFCSRFLIPVGLAIRVSSAFSFLIIGWIWILTGARLGMLRPWWVIFLRRVAQRLGFRWKRGSPLFLVLLAEAIASPLLPSHHRLGGWIYALAVGGGMMGLEAFRDYSLDKESRKPPSLILQIQKHALAHLGLAIGSWVFPALWEAWESGTVALATPLLSLITLPTLCVFFYPLLILGVMVDHFRVNPSLVTDPLDFDSGAARLVSETTKIFSTGFLQLAEFSFQKGNLWVVSPGSLQISSFLILTCFAFKKIPFKKLTRTLLLSLVILWMIFRVTSAGRSPALLEKSSVGRNLETEQVEQLDVGQGDAALISTGNTRVGDPIGMIDTGSQFSLTEDHWIQIFAKRRIQRLSWVVLTHLDEDHSGGLFRLAQVIPIDSVVIPRAERDSARGKKLESQLGQFDIRLNDETSHSLPFPIFSLRPNQAERCLRSTCANENMLAAWVPLKGGGFYLSAGDASSKDEDRLRPWLTHLDKEYLPTFPRILKISHHGSRTSTSLSFLKIVRPTEAWISSGQGNRYGHPTAVVLQKLKKLGIPIYRTDRQGVLSNTSVISSESH